MLGSKISRNNSRVIIIALILFVSYAQRSGPVQALIQCWPWLTRRRSEWPGITVHVASTTFQTKADGRVVTFEEKLK